MISANSFLEKASEQNYSFFCGVPCSFLTPLINRAISNPELNYVGATSEGEAIAIAAGAWLTGRKTVVMCQNSGLGNMVNPLTSLNWPFNIPTLLIVTWRGEPGLKDEPQHELMGKITPDILDNIKIPHSLFPTEESQISQCLSKADEYLKVHNLPYAMIMKKNSVEIEKLDQPKPAGRALGILEDRTKSLIYPTRNDALNLIVDKAPDIAAIIATTGKTGRELFSICDRPQHFYQVGSMGCASAIGLGVALNTKKLVIVLDGDGSILMKMGTLATIGAYKPKNLLHIILDNGVHDSTGGQATVSTNVSFAATAKACGYQVSYICDSLDEFSNVLENSFNAPKPCLIHLRINAGSISPLGRPNITPAEVARRFQRFIAN